MVDLPRVNARELKNADLPFAGRFVAELMIVSTVSQVWSMCHT